MLSDEQINQIQSTLFADERKYTYAIVDGAACPELRFKLYYWHAESICLWSGDLEADLEEVAPYLIRLERDADITKWLIKEGWENHWSIFVLSRLELKAFRKEIRKFQLARSPEGETLFFRFYDPRVMEIFLPTCNDEQRSELFNHIEALYFATGANFQLTMARKDGVTELFNLIHGEKH